MFYISRLPSGYARIAFEEPTEEEFIPFFEFENLPAGDGILSVTSKGTLFYTSVPAEPELPPPEAFLSGLMEGYQDSPIEEPKAQGQQAYNDIRQGTDVSAVTFVILAQSELVDDITIAENAELFPLWDENYTTQNRLTIVRDEDCLYRNIHPIFDKSQNIKPSSDTGSIMWQLIGCPLDEYPMWVQPLGVHDAYEPGAKVSHKEKKWVNTHTALNTWEPGVYGWTEVTV